MSSRSPKEAENPVTDRIERKIVLRASRSRVWRALADHKEFEAWFSFKVDQPFKPGATLLAVITGSSPNPDVARGKKHLVGKVIAITIEKMEPERLFSFRWHPHAIEAGVDYSAEPTTLVEFKLEDVLEGVLVTVTESGFDHIPLSRRATAFTANSRGWTIMTGVLGTTLPSSHKSRGSDFSRSASLFAALGDQTRLRLIRRLCDRGPMSISSLTSGSRRTRQAITKHLQVMEGAGIVQSRRRGREQLWRLDQARLAEARRHLDTISAEWDRALGRLRDFVEGSV